MVQATPSAAHVRHVETCLDGGRKVSLPPRALIIDSWKRCASQYRLDPSRSERTRILTSSELKDFREPMSPLMRIARPILEDLYRLLEPIGYCVLFTDLNGVAFDFLSPPSLDAEHRTAGLYLGSVWTEETEGTNGVGTCIVTGRPLTVHRTDHFRSKNADLSCTVAPVFDPDGGFAAVLDVSTARPDKGGVTRYAEHLVDVATRRLTNAWFRERHRDHWVLRLFPDSENLDPAREGLVALDADGDVVAVSETGRKILAAALPDLAATPAPTRRNPAGPRHAKPGRGPQRDGDHQTATALAAWAATLGSLHDGPRHLPAAAGSGQPLYLIPMAPMRGGRRTVTIGQTSAGSAARPRAGAARQARASRHGEDEAPLSLEALAGGDPTLAEAVRFARRARDGGVPLLVTGETGTGKTTFARALHADTSDGRLVEIALAGREAPIVERLLAEALPEAATLVLDDIGETSDAAQHAVLRQLKRLEGDGLRRPTLVSTSQQPIGALQSGLRADLFFRLAGAHVALPPLRQRRDRQALIAAVAEELADRLPTGIDEARIAALAAARWPGNLWELRSVLRLVLAGGDIATGAGGIAALQAPDGDIHHPYPAELALAPHSLSAGGPIVEQAVDDLEQLLVANQWCVSKVARLLAVDRSTIHRRMNRFGLVPPQRRN